MKVFKSETRSIELRTRDKSLEEICEAMNRIRNSNLKSYPLISMIPSIHVTKKYFSDFFPFNFAHLASLMIEAEAEYMDPSQTQLVFTIGLNSLYSISNFLGILLLSALTVYALFAQEFLLGLCILIFTIVAVLWSIFLYRIGMKNFLKNWDDRLNIEI